MPVMAPVPAPLTVIWPVAKSRPPATRRESFSESAPRSTRAATPIAIPASVSTLRSGRRRRLRIASAMAAMARPGVDDGGACCKRYRLARRGRAG
jgi:hypothetical protein